MFEYQEWMGMTYGVVSLVLTIFGPVLANRWLNIIYPKAIFSLALFCIAFIQIDQFIHRSVFSIPTQPGALDDLFALTIPVWVFSVALVVDFVWVKLQRKSRA